MIGKEIFAQKIGEWYEENKRNLPWRNTNDPYRIWLSEIILQQTRVAQGLPYYHAFIRRFPTIVVLARAREESVLRAWQGLGYYSRAHNLHACARKIVKDYGGRFPTSFESLMKLPGIGPYSAAAIASLAFNEQVPVVDGNVFRVMARVFGITENIAGPRARDIFFAKAKELIPADRPSAFNQAVMEFGALCCVPRNPNCGTCIFGDSCFASLHGHQNILPVKIKGRKIRRRHLDYFILMSEKRIALRKRADSDIWKGLYEFYLVESTRQLRPQSVVQSDAHLRGAKDRIEIVSVSRLYRHTLSHQSLSVRFVEVRVKKFPLAKIATGERFGWYKKEEIRKLPKPILLDRYLRERRLI